MQTLPNPWLYPHRALPDGTSPSGLTNITVSPLVGTSNTSDVVSPSSKLTLSVTASSIDGAGVQYFWQVRISDISLGTSAILSRKAPPWCSRPTGEH